MAGKKVLSVGQCDFDHGSIEARLRGLFGASVVPVDGADEAKALLGREKFDLVLINRVFDADGGSGLTLIEALKGPSQSPLMLVSNFPEAQAQAVAAGAVPGFGKSALGDLKLMQTLLAPYLG